MMAARSKIAIWSTVVIVVALATSFGIHKSWHRITLQGVLIRQDPDPDKQSPVPGAQITAISGSATGSASSDSLGYFSLTLPESFRRRKSVTLKVRLPGYRPVDLTESIGKLYVIHMQPTSIAKPVEPNRQPPVLISNVRIRYSVKTTTELDVGSEVKTLQVRNTGNVPCDGQHPCSPDGKWRAADGSTELDAGAGDEFRNARVACIAGPCPFTKVENQSVSEDGRVLNVMARDWSDTATFLVEAEVVRPMVSDLVRESYPVIFGPTLSFSLPGTAEGPSIEAEVNGQAIVFPLGPDLLLSWAKCTTGISRDQSKVYRCELKPGYQFK
jgi:hypothetical protein